MCDRVGERRVAYIGSDCEVVTSRLKVSVDQSRKATGRLAVLAVSTMGSPNKGARNRSVKSLGPLLQANRRALEPPRSGNENIGQRHQRLVVGGRSGNDDLHLIIETLKAVGERDNGLPGSS